MCEDCADFARTVALLADLALYSDRLDCDDAFITTVAPALAASLPEPPPDNGPDYPGGW
ncbi:hypothetical protein DSC45_18750 [Streptomyces sp. YIM 130001]|uniref:hypothetical protein n=1 Tax=Streptomyces sp. YIM 130001 TaxID=2259644 RepID=UPI000EC7AF02|nr:hypothetical protein [Streptomyces sp. YIM 130001]RII15346.1 hypothetical protein DSC45_18750 [Streptomyces sp. YIM 130001]